MSLIDQIRSFQRRAKYATNLEDPLYQSLVRQYARQLRTEDANDQESQEIRQRILGRLDTGGKGGMMKATESGRFYPEGPEPLGVIEEELIP